jgi:hypothetical protein
MRRVECCEARPSEIAAATLELEPQQTLSIFSDGILTEHNNIVLRYHKASYLYSTFYW